MSPLLVNPESLTKPLDETSPSGVDLAYDARFIELEQAAAGKPDSQYGDRHYPAEPPNWPLVHELGLELAARTLDLRVAVCLVRSSARLHGLAGFAAALALVHGLLVRYWDSVHPQLDAADGNDPTMRLNVLATLAAPNAVLADLRAATLAPVRASLTLRDIELAFGRAEPGPEEAVPTEAGLTSALKALLAAHTEIPAQAAAARSAAQGITAELERRVGAANAPDLAALDQLLALLAGAVQRAQGGPAADERLAVNAALHRPEGSAHTAASDGAIRSRSDANRALERVCEWIEHNEPSNPAPLLIRRAQRLMDKSFLDIVRDLAPDGLGQVERIAGTEAST